MNSKTAGRPQDGSRTAGELTGADFAKLIETATAAAARRTAARAPGVLDTYRRNREDITQAAALDVLERINAGDPAEIVQLASRAANRALVKAYRQEHDARTTPAEIETEDGETIPRPDLYRPEDAGRSPEAAAAAADLVTRIINAMPAAYRADAREILYLTAAGYTAAEIAGRKSCSPRRIQRAIKAARDAARMIYA